MECKADDLLHPLNDILIAEPAVPQDAFQRVQPTPAAKMVAESEGKALLDAVPAVRSYSCQ